MTARLKHVVSFSNLPRHLDAKASRTQQVVSLHWKILRLKQRIQFVLNLLSERAVRVHIEFVRPDEMAELNLQFRNKDRPTDVLSFVPHLTQQLWTDEQTQKQAAFVNFGELAVCLEVCAQQAKRHRCTLAEEVERMVVHGLIHLRGFDHERSSAAYAVMTSLEKTVRLQVSCEFGRADFCATSSSQVRSSTVKRRGARSC